MRMTLLTQIAMQMTVLDQTRLKPLGAISAASLWQHIHVRTEKDSRRATLQFVVWTMLFADS